MLVLGRKLGEKLIIGGNIEITVLSQDGKRVRLGIEAPKNISIHRDDHYQKKINKTNILAKSSRNEER